MATGLRRFRLAIAAHSRINTHHGSVAVFVTLVGPARISRGIRIIGICAGRSCRRGSGDGTGGSHAKQRITKSGDAASISNHLIFINITGKWKKNGCLTVWGPIRLHSQHLVDLIFLELITTLFSEKSHFLSEIVSLCLNSISK